ncbi:DEAD/DEAH box helicase family protein, partial [Streptococcus mutans]|nr:DEAD/DEAH box helicase family protein [Streptococcus mutans]
MNVEDGLKVKLYRHQQLALTYMRINNAYALFMEQGTGKTIPSLVRVCELLRSGDIENALVVAPKSALGAWERDIEIFSPSDQRTLKRGLTLINYDKVWRTRNGVNPYDKEWGCIILDEAHSIKNRTSKRSEFILKLATKSKYRYILTGTPIGNGQLENIWEIG